MAVRLPALVAEGGQAAFHHVAMFTISEADAESGRAEVAHKRTLRRPTALA